MSFALIVDSTHRYSDVWPLYFGQLSLHFKSDIPKYLFTDTLGSFSFDGVTPIYYSNDDSYRNQLLGCLKQVKEEYILYNSEDYVLFDDVNSAEFNNWGKKKFENKNGFILVSNEGMGEVNANTVQAKIDQHKPDIVILDYHQLFTDTKRSNGATERNMNISREFKMLAVRNNIPVIDITAATAEETSDHDAPPMLNQVAWSKAIEYDADMAVAVHKNPDSNIMEVVSRKNRHGTEFGMYLDWDLNRGIVSEVYDIPIQ